MSVVVDAVAGCQDKCLIPNRDRQLALKHESTLFSRVGGRVIPPRTRAAHDAIRLDRFAKQIGRQKLHVGAIWAEDRFAPIGSDHAGRCSIILKEVSYFHVQYLGDACQPRERRPRHAPFDLRQIAGRQANLLSQLHQGKPTICAQSSELLTKDLHGLSLYRRLEDSWGQNTVVQRRLVAGVLHAMFHGRVEVNAIAGTQIIDSIPNPEAQDPL